MGLRFGKEDKIECIVDVDVRVGDNEPACLASKTTTYWVGAGAYLADGGYVLRSRKGLRDVYYELPPGAAEGRVEGLPHPFPTYSINAADYVWGYSLWWMIGLMILWPIGLRSWRRRRQASFAANAEALPIDRGPPRLETEGDRFVYEAIKAQLAPGERIEHQAYTAAWDYGSDKEGDDVFFVALATQRLYVMTTRRGGFGIVYENEGIESIERSAITDSRIDHGNVLFIATHDGIERGFVVQETRRLSNQNAFLVNAARLLKER